MKTKEQYAAELAPYIAAEQEAAAEVERLASALMQAREQHTRAKRERGKMALAESVDKWPAAVKRVLQDAESLEDIRPYLSLRGLIRSESFFGAPVGIPQKLWLAHEYLRERRPPA